MRDVNNWLVKLLKRKMNEAHQEYLNASFENNTIKAKYFETIYYRLSEHYINMVPINRKNVS